MSTPHMRLTGLVWVLSTALLLPGCGDHAGDEARTASELNNLTFERVAHAAGGDLPWGRIVALASTSAGEIVVADDQSALVFVLDPDGGLRRSFGGRGDGPGQFGSLFSVLVQEDEVLTLDPLRRRITRFTPQGEVLSTLSPPLEAGFPIELVANGLDAVLTGQVNRESTEPEPGGILRRRQPELRYSRIGVDGLVDLAIPDTANAPRGFDCYGPGRGVAIFGTPLLGPAGPLRAFPASGHLARGAAEAPAIEFVEPGSGRTVGVLELQVTPQPLSDGDWDAVTLPFREREREQGPFECEVDGLRPTHWPVVRSIVTDDRGWLWVEMAADRNERYRIAVFDTDGRLRAAGDLPARDARVPLHVRGDHVYLVTVDAVGLQSVEVYAAHHP